MPGSECSGWFGGKLLWLSTTRGWKSRRSWRRQMVWRGKGSCKAKLRALGVSVMTLHRWRKAQPGPQRGFVAINGAGQPDRTPGGGDRIAELQLENSRLRQLVTDILLETFKFKEAAQRPKRRRPKST